MDLDDSLEFDWMGSRYRLSPGRGGPHRRSKALTPEQARWALAGLLRDASRRGAFIGFLRRGILWSLFWSDVTETKLISLIARELDGHRLVVAKVDAWDGPDARGELTEVQQVVRAAMAGRRWIRFENQNLVLVESLRWRQTNQGGNLQVVRWSAALPLLDRLANAPGFDAARHAAFVDAKDLLVDRIRPGVVSGVVLARQMEASGISGDSDDPAVTPSQLARAAKDDAPISITVERRYHDDTPIQGAPFELEFSDGTIMRGTLGSDGKGTISGVPDTTAMARFGPDQRAFAPVPQDQNPSFKSSMSDSGYDGLVDKFWQAGA